MIHAKKLSKCYTIYHRPLDRLHDWFVPKPRARGRPFWALHDIDLEVARGAALGIVGVNGAGKSTLLKLLTGTTVPTSGTFRVEGRVSALLELGMGFHPEFTGRENIALNGKMLGLSDEELREKTPSIIDFSELNEFIDQPLKTYSSGMMMRLAFSVASSVNPDVLIVDEALAVGDVHFQQKCLARIRRFHAEGMTVLFVSHDPALVKSFCGQAILLDAGRLIDRGRPDDVLDYYSALLAEKYRGDGARARIIRPRRETAAPNDAATDEENENASAETKTPANAEPIDVARPANVPDYSHEGHRAGNFEGAIAAVFIRSPGHSGNPNMIHTGAEAAFAIRAVAFAHIENPTIGFMIKDRLGNEIYGTNTHIRGVELGPLESGQAIEVEFFSPMNLGPGFYTITAALHAGATHTEMCYDWIERALTFQVLPSPVDPFQGLARLDLRIAHRTEPAREEELALQKGLKGS